MPMCMLLGVSLLLGSQHSEEGPLSLIHLCTSRVYVVPRMESMVRPSVSISTTIQSMVHSHEYRQPSDYIYNHSCILIVSITSTSRRPLKIQTQLYELLTLYPQIKTRRWLPFPFIALLAFNVASRTLYQLLPALPALFVRHLFCPVHLPYLERLFPNHRAFTRCSLCLFSCSISL